MTRLFQTVGFTIIVLQSLAAARAQDVFETYEESLYYTNATLRPGHLTDAAEAQIRLQTARSMELDNDFKKAKTFFDKREANLRRRAELRSLRHEITRQRGVERQLAESKRKHTPQEKIPSIVAGTVKWPKALRSTSFGSDRGMIERTVEKDALLSEQVDSNTDALVDEVINRMKYQLRKQIRQLSPTEYVAAKRFLESLQRDFEVPSQDGFVVSAR